MNNYYLRGPLNTQPFLMQARVGSALYYATLASTENKEEYIVFRRGASYGGNLVTFVAQPQVSGVTLRGEVGGRNFALGVKTYSKNLVLAPRPSGEAPELFLPVTKEVKNFGLFLAGVAYYLLYPAQDNSLVSLLLAENEGNNPPLQFFSQFYVLPLQAFYQKTTIPLRELLTIEQGWAEGAHIEPLFTNQFDALENRAYFYCKESDCASNCKGGCSRSDQVCSFDENLPGFLCLVPSGDKVPFVKGSLFLSLAITLGVVFLLSIILLLAIIFTS